jgi:hypothetical protein
MKLVGLPILRRGAAKPSENAWIWWKRSPFIADRKRLGSAVKRATHGDAPRVYTEAAERVAKRFVYEVEIRPIVPKTRSQLCPV